MLKYYDADNYAEETGFNRRYVKEAYRGRKNCDKRFDFTAEFSDSLLSEQSASSAARSASSQSRSSLDLKLEIMSFCNSRNLRHCKSTMSNLLFSQLE